MNITFRQLRAFVLVAESASFSRAATHLFMTQSALSGLIRELESALSIKLFDRTTRQVRLSQMGEQLLPHAKRVLNDLAMLESEAKSLTGLEQGEIRLAVSQQFAASSMPILIAKFNEKYPNIRITLMDCSVDSVPNHLKNMDVDLGIGAERTHSNEIEKEMLFELPFFIALPATHRLIAFEQITWQDLAHEPLISLYGPFSEKLAEELSEALPNFVFEPKYYVNLISTALGMTKRELGLTICLPFATDWVQQQGLAMRLITEPIVNRRFFLYRQKDRALSPAITVFIDFIKQYLAEHNFSEQASVQNSHYNVR